MHHALETSEGEREKQAWWIQLIIWSSTLTSAAFRTTRVIFFEQHIFISYPMWKKKQTCELPAALCRTEWMKTWGTCHSRSYGIAGEGLKFLVKHPFSSISPWHQLFTGQSRSCRGSRGSCTELGSRLKAAVKTKLRGGLDPKVFFGCA